MCHNSKTGPYFANHSLGLEDAPMNRVRGGVSDTVKGGYGDIIGMDGNSILTGEGVKTDKRFTCIAIEVYQVQL